MRILEKKKHVALNLRLSKIKIYNLKNISVENGNVMHILKSSDRGFEKFGEFLPTDPSDRAECMSWLFWQMGSAPYLGGGFGHFYAYAPEKYEYPINRFAMEVKRQLDVLDRNLESREYLCGSEYNISDIAVHSWYGTLVLNNAYNASEFLEVESYKHVGRWAKQIIERPAYKRGSLVNKKPNGPDDKSILERQDASDIKL